MFNTIILVIIGIIFTIYTMRTVNGIDHNNFHISDLIVAILCLVIIVQARFYDTSIAKSYNNGYNTAIESAELINVHDNCYTISFNGEVHSYTIDGNHLVEIEDKD